MFEYAHGEPPENILTVLRALEVNLWFIFQVLVLTLISIDLRSLRPPNFD